jgi:hypothetical protein
MEDQAAPREGNYDMKDLNLGPDSRKLVERLCKLQGQRAMDDGASFVEHTASMAVCATAMAAMLERWMTVAWCWPDNCPATICGGPHVTVRYDFDKTVDVIEPYNKIGTTFPEAPYHVINS